MLRSDFCDYSDKSIDVKETLAVDYSYQKLNTRL